MHICSKQHSFVQNSPLSQCIEYTSSTNQPADRVVGWRNSALWLLITVFHCNEAIESDRKGCSEHR